MAVHMLLGGLVLVFLAISYTVQWRRRNARLPPQPPSLPLIGNAHQFAAAAKTKSLHLMLERWAREFGDIVRVQLGPVNTYYLNSDIAVKEVMDRNSAHSAQRPLWLQANNIMTNQWNVLFLQGSEPRWKHQRKIAHSELTSVPRADAGVSFLHYETAKFLHEVANDPAAGTDQQNLWAQIGRYTYSTFAMQTLGLEITSADDPNIDYIHATLPLTYLIDIFPVLQQLPLFLKPWEQKGRALFKDNLEWCIKRKEQLMGEGAGILNAKETMLHRVLSDPKLGGFGSEEEAAYLCLMLIQGAADTSKMSTMSFLEAMITYPDIQKKAQEEIDEIVGNRVPVWEDFANIPYVRCLMKEVWRWRPPVALGHPHVTTKDLEFKGMLIPKGSRLNVNAWAIHHDPARYESPHVFNPDRFRNDTTTSQQSINASNVADRDHFAFGAGRRVCPGYHVAERSLAVSIMRILWAFDVKVAPRAKLPLDPQDFAGFMPGNPGANLPACLVVRNSERKNIIGKCWEDTRSIMRTAGSH